MKIHHIGYLVKDIKKSVEQFKDLGYSIEVDILYDESRDVEICFMINAGYRIELVSPCSEQSVVYEQLKRIGNSPYHVCYVVSDINQEMQRLRERKYVIMIQPQRAVAFAGKRVVFLYHRNVGMIELVEE